MNTYSKYVPNVFLAKCSEKHEKGEVIIESITFVNEVENNTFIFFSILGGNFNSFTFFVLLITLCQKYIWRKFVIRVHFFN